MSTRCNIIIDNGRAGKAHGQIILYHHHDGYPEGVGADLAEFLTENNYKPRERWYGAAIANGLVKDADDEYEVTMTLHDDIEYLYVINTFNGTLHCYAVDWEVAGWDKPMDLSVICQSKYEREIPDWSNTPKN